MLTPKQQRFVEEYLIDLNATQAAIRSGYSPKTANEQGAQLLAKLSIQAAIQEAREAQSKRTGITADRVLQELALIAFADMKDYADIEPGGGVTLKPFDEMPKGASKAISKIKERRKVIAEAEGEGKETVIDCQLEFGHWDKTKALELLGRHLGIFNDKLKLQGDAENPLKVDLSGLSDAELSRLIQDA